MSSNTAVLYRGPGTLGGDILVTGTIRSANSKTGNMIQVTIMPDPWTYGLPFHTTKTGADSVVCGECRHRLDGT